MADGRATKKGRKVATAGTRGISSSVVVVAVIAVVVIGGIVALAVRNRALAPCTPTGSHEHASFGVSVNDQSIRWTGAAFNYPAAGELAGHIHQPASQTIHMESGTSCITLGSFFSHELQSSLTRDTLTLDSVLHKGESYHAGDGGKLRFFLGEPPAGWRDNATRSYLPSSEVSWKENAALPEHQPRDGEYLLVTFGNDDDAAIRAQQLALPTQNAKESGT